MFCNSYLFLVCDFKYISETIALYLRVDVALVTKTTSIRLRPISSEEVTKAKMQNATTLLHQVFSLLSYLLKSDSQILGFLLLE